VNRRSDADWLGRAAPAAAFVYRTNSLVNQLVAARTGIGIALLPCDLGDGHLGLARALADPIPEFAGKLWIITHADLKDTARARVLRDRGSWTHRRTRHVFRQTRDRRGRYLSAARLKPWRPTLKHQTDLRADMHAGRRPRK
jgi:DNA-binding transcriptional LysR family regulator